MPAIPDSSVMEGDSQPEGWLQWTPALKEGAMAEELRPRIRAQLVRAAVGSTAPGGGSGLAEGGRLGADGAPEQVRVGRRLGLAQTGPGLVQPVFHPEPDGLVGIGVALKELF